MDSNYNNNISSNYIDFMENNKATDYIMTATNFLS